MVDTARSVEVVRVQAAGSGRTADTIAELVHSLRAALDGSGPALLPVSAGPPGDKLVAAADLDNRDHPVDSGTALLLPTSGSTGHPKVVEVSAAALLAGAHATHARIGPPGRWALSLPLTHVAGWQVLVRGLLADGPDQLPEVVPLDHGAGPVRYTALVPTQLARALDDPTAIAALARLDAVLLGGAATPEPLRRKALDAGIPVVSTYGSTETCGGCLYDGVPLDGVHTRISDAGRLMLAGPVLATRYRADAALTASTFQEVDGRRWYLTGDRAEIDSDGIVTVTGRHDDVIVTGGENVAPAAVEASLAEHPFVREAVVVGVPDAEWGELVVAVVSLSSGTGEAADDHHTAGRTLRDHVAATLGRHAAPRHVVVVDEVPTRGIGKPDRTAALRVAAEHLAALTAPAERWR